MHIFVLVYEQKINKPSMALILELFKLGQTNIYIEMYVSIEYLQFPKITNFPKFQRYRNYKMCMRF